MTFLTRYFDDKTSLKETVTGIAESVGKTLASAGSLTEGAQSAVQASGKAAADAIGSAIAPIRNPQKLRIAGGAIAVIAVAGWVFSSWDSTPADIAPAQADAVPTTADSGVTFAPPIRETEVRTCSQNHYPSFPHTRRCLMMHDPHAMQATSSNPLVTTPSSST